jgi:hypothetical protein
MKRIFYTLSLIALTLGANAQFILEDFASVAGTALTSAGWTVTAANTTNVIATATPGLTFTNYPGSGVNNAAALANTGQDLYLGGTGSIVSGNAYAGAMINISAVQATGDYFWGMLQSTSTSNFVGRVFAKTTTGGYLLGLSKGNEASGPVYGTTIFSLNTTYAIVLKYTFNTGTTTDDQLYLYAFTSSFPTTEPLTPEVGPVTSTVTDAPNIARVYLRQGSAANAPTLTIDGLRLTDTWGNGNLPVKWASFIGSKSTDASILKWSTSSETNNSHFEIQRSVDGKNFEAIGKVKGSGNSNRSVNYSFTDKEAATTKTTYYRLKQVDFDGKSEYSKTVSVVNTIAKAGIGATLPNPFNNDLNVTVNASSATVANIVIMDMIGKIHHTSTEQLQSGVNTISINTTDMPDGIYFVRVSYNGETYTQKVVKK